MQDLEFELNMASKEGSAPEPDSTRVRFAIRIIDSPHSSLSVSQSYTISQSAYKHVAVGEISGERASSDRR